MEYIIFDLEFNSAFKIDRKTKKLIKGNANPLCPQEIIEIGAVKANTKLEIEDTFQTFVKPQLYTKLHPKVKKKTKITKEDLAEGLAFQSAMKLFTQWLGTDEVVMCSWGQDDINELRRNCDFFHIKTNWIKKHCDVQKICTGHLAMPRGEQVGLKRAIEALQIDIDRDFHKALNDAIYTAKILKVLKEPKN
ncbi:exonuclease, Rnase T and DNA polymerase III [Clostridium aceticum]|uniref:Exonuclease, Rnase T and DNA polymerase III n=1 Tax=Clostridium aceticum TaxID=84022 RepID=A0A0G3WBK8_9CLOT|nr:3'-5' exonuclease [Clostridium aceticum]AKL95312.1 exonuclease, Rnase T and DNA polymerase III [Clostridium aceticum]